MISTLQSYTAITRDIDGALARVASDRATKRETAYYLSQIGQIKTLDDFMSNRRVYSFAMRAFGLEEMIPSRALIKKVLEGGIDDRRSLANTMSDPRFRELAETFNFKRYEAATTSFGRAQQGTVDRFMRTALEQNAGSQNEAVRLALYFERKAPDVTSIYGLMADRALYKVVETALGLPAGLPGAGIEKQAKIIGDRLDLATLKDPKGLAKFIARFATLWDIGQSATGPASLSSSGIVGVDAGAGGPGGISSATLASIQALRLKRGG